MTKHQGNEATSSSIIIMNQVSQIRQLSSFSTNMKTMHVTKNDIKLQNSRNIVAGCPKYHPAYQHTSKLITSLWVACNNIELTKVYITRDCVYGPPGIVSSIPI